MYCTVPFYPTFILKGYSNIELSSYPIKKSVPLHRTFVLYKALFKGAWHSNTKMLSFGKGNNSAHLTLQYREEWAVGTEQISIIRR